MEEVDRPCVHSAGERGQTYKSVLRLEVAWECIGFLILFIVTCVDSIVIVQLVLYNGGEELGMGVSVCIRKRRVGVGARCSWVSRTD